MERLGGEVKRELSRFGTAGTIPEIVKAWPAAVGPDVARNAWPARVTAAGVLHVNTSSSLWAFELTQLAGDVQRQLVEALGDDAPTSLRFTPGSLPEPAAEAPAQAVTGPAEPSPDDVAEGRRLAASIGDEELRERVAEAAARSLQRARSDRGFW